MSNTPHELHEEFPEYAQRIHDLKAKNGHFLRLAEKYHDINRAVHRAETNVEPVDQFTEEEMRKQRLALKDEIYKILTSEDA